MSSQQKRGFRLPWAAEHAPEEGAAGAATLDPASDPTGGVDSDDLGDGPFGLAGASQTLTTDPAPAGSDVPEISAEAAMTVESTATESAESPAGADDQVRGNAWPDVDRPSSPQHAVDAERAAARPAIHAVGAASVPRRENPLVAGLVKAMREAAIASRDETLARLKTEAETRVSGIRGRATSEAAELKQRAETDISEIREWSKAEIARIREKTETRIETRKTELAGETERHAASVERLVEDVHSVVGTFEGDMDRFFERLLAENDPARLAALAEQAPDAPDFTGDGPAALDLLDQPAPALEADAAAAAEVAAREGLDMDAAATWPAAVAADGNNGSGDVPEADDDGATRLLVTGLASVAGISAFKGALGQLPGVHAVSVSSGDPGVFVFAINHDPEIDLATGVASIDGFAARITDATDTGITVVAHEPAA
jgi:hypothetical protein